MRQIKLFVQIFYMFFIVIFSNTVMSEPFVVLQYRGDIKTTIGESNNIFMQDNNHKTKHIVQKNETLSDIMLKYYGTKLFNKNILSLAIVEFNKHAFVRNNPNFLFSGKKVYLPSINEIKNLIINKNNKARNNEELSPGTSSQIYFFGG